MLFRSDLIDEGYDAVGHGTTQLVEQARQLDQGVGKMYKVAGQRAQAVAQTMSALDASVSVGYAKAGEAALRVTEGLTELEQYAEEGATQAAVIITSREALAPRVSEDTAFNLQNVTIGSLIVAVLLLILLAILYIFGGQVL